jgi:hypothetical protein
MYRISVSLTQNIPALGGNPQCELHTVLDGSETQTRHVERSSPSKMLLAIPFGANPPFDELSLSIK